jgi:hypothetical protein
MPATMIVAWCCGGCVLTIWLANVPVNMAGKIGKSQAGVIDWTVKRLGGAVKRKVYCPVASKKTQARYIQNATRCTTISHGPQTGTA